jgi:hypothetical protein
LVQSAESKGKNAQWKSRAAKKAGRKDSQEKEEYPAIRVIICRASMKKGFGTNQAFYLITG